MISVRVDDTDDEFHDSCFMGASLRILQIEYETPPVRKLAGKWRRDVDDLQECTSCRSCNCRKERYLSLLHIGSMESDD